MPLEHAAVAIIALTGVRPSEARGLRWEEWDRAKGHMHICRAVWHTHVGTTKTEQSVRFVTVTDELRDILLTLWNTQGSPISGYILAGPRKGNPVNLDNRAKRSIREALKKSHGPGGMRCGTEVRLPADSETASKALGNSKAVADKHYIKPQSVPPDVRNAVNSALSGLIH